MGKITVKIYRIENTVFTSAWSITVSVSGFNGEINYGNFLKLQTFICRDSTLRPIYLIAMIHDFIQEVWSGIILDIYDLGLLVKNYCNGWGYFV